MLTQLPKRPKAPPKAPPRMPRAPRRPPPPPRPPLGPRELAIRGSLIMVLVIVGAFLAHLIVFSHLQHLVTQQQLRDTFGAQLEAGTAPVSEGTFEDVLLRDGEPVARIEIPTIGVDEIVVEGTSSGTLMSGPGHRRDTSLPGQNGVSVLMGRASAFGGPFSRIHELSPGDTFSVITGQGEHIYEIIGVRFAGDARPAPAKANEGQLILETAKGFPYVPSGLTRVDSKLISTVHPKGVRDTTFRSLPAAHKELAGDTSTLWALVFALQLLVVTELGAVYVYRKVGFAKTWIVASPLLLFTGILVADQAIKTLPNLL